MSERRVCAENQCTGCMACVELCPQKAIHIVDTVTAYNAEIDMQACVDCGLCQTVCQNNQPVELEAPVLSCQGWIKDETIRSRSSSGGAAMALARVIIDQGGVVCGCAFENGTFGFRFVENKEELCLLAGSKYVKSTPLGVYKELNSRLRENKKVLFIGLPCQVAAVRKAVKANNQVNLYTVDLICHGTPSPKLLDNFLGENNCSLDTLRDVQFRNKAVFGLSTDGVHLTTPGVCDPYLLAFLCGLIYTDHCYECQYATSKRVSDLTLGDSWGSDMAEDEQKKGISLILCQTEKGRQLLQAAEMQLFPVDIGQAIQHNDQLRAPSLKTALHDRFFAKYDANGFTKAVFYSLPYKCVKQKIKAQLIKLKMWKN